MEEVLKENPADIKAHTIKGDILATKQDYLGAITEYRAVVHEDPQNVHVSMNLARAHDLNNEPLLAEQTYQKLLEQNPDVTQARLALAEIYWGKKSRMENCRSHFSTDEES